MQSSIDQSLIDRLTPRIISLQQASRDPITIYIDSRGGSTLAAELLLRLLAASSQDFAPSCRLITVVTGTAASAAADLLSSGDYAIGYPDSTVYYHGVRQSLQNPLTAEVASSLTEALRISNDKFAMTLARKSNGRFLFRYVWLRSQFEGYRASMPSTKAISDLDCFMGLLRGRLSESANRVLEQAGVRHERYKALLARMLKFAFKSRQFTHGKRIAELEAAMLKGVIDFELANNKDLYWTFQNSGGLAKLNDDFLLLREYLAPHQNDHLSHLCDRWKNFFLTDEDREELRTVPEEQRKAKEFEKLKPHFQPLWFFFVALCHALQEGENELTATDAYWLGLIDEVMGVEELPCLRMISEFQDDHGKEEEPPAPTAEV